MRAYTCLSTLEVDLDLANSMNWKTDNVLKILYLAGLLLLAYLPGLEVRAKEIADRQSGQKMLSAVEADYRAGHYNQALRRLESISYSGVIGERAIYYRALCLQSLNQCGGAQACYKWLFQNAVDRDVRIKAQLAFEVLENAHNQRVSYESRKTKLVSGVRHLPPPIKINPKYPLRMKRGDLLDRDSIYI